MAKVLSCSVKNYDSIIKKLMTCGSYIRQRNGTCSSIIAKCGSKISRQISDNNVPLLRFLSTSPYLCVSDDIHSTIKNDQETKSILQEIFTDFENEAKQRRKEPEKEERNDLSERVSDISNNKDDDNSSFSAESKNSENYAYDYEEFIDDDHDVVYENVVERVIPISLERGTEGVYNIGELVKLLETENTKDICVINVPKEYNYVNQIVIGTAKSTRQLTAIAEEVKQLFKKKRRKGDQQSVKIEGENSKDWKALDLGNIALHLFLQKTRELYDLETLWTVGAEYDPMSVEEEDDYGLFLPFKPDDEGMQELAEYVKKKHKRTESAMRDTIVDEMDQALDDFRNSGDFHGDKDKR
ncbi:unnamed protein product [Owenia fusiformis]|uniref:Mitochondrial assembly of ribosomal large subunit protein 1 n=1 Tax=Owenia fusiformis TaxID=6347 RepID=A0A8J1TU86_OWEFU|nr:unnamed protein product [Owenia fusiformis]